MNERIKKLAEQAGFEYSSQWTYWTAHEPELERFAELIRLDERAACAKLCDDEADQSSSDHEAGGMYWCAEAIRQRENNHETT